MDFEETCDEANSLNDEVGKGKISVALSALKLLHNLPCQQRLKKPFNFVPREVEPQPNRSRPLKSNCNVNRD